MAEFEFCSVERKGRVDTITIERPEVMNALHPPAHYELAQAFDDFAGDDATWVAVITGAGGRAFCAGSDLKYKAEHPGENFTPTGFAGLTSRFDLRKPVIAKVNGVALGGGLEIALACDLVVAAEHVRFGFPEPKVGLAALGGGLHRLARQIPLKQAMELILTGEPVSAAEGQRLGFVNRVVPADQLDATVAELVANILACAPLALQASKAMVMDSLDEAKLAAAITRAHPAAADMLVSADALEGPRAFAEKRAPVWRGE